MTAPTKDYDGAAAAFRRQRARARSAATRKDHKAVVLACERAFDAFDDAGVYPDDWALFVRLAEDAVAAVRFDWAYPPEELTGLEDRVARLRQR
jgi:hypothetical protein